MPFVRVWALDPELLLCIARFRVTRSLTDEECRRYLQRPCSNGHKALSGGTGSRVPAGTTYVPSLVGDGSATGAAGRP